MPSDASQNKDPFSLSEDETELSDSIKQVVLSEQPEERLIDPNVDPERTLGAKLSPLSRIRQTVQKTSQWFTQWFQVSETDLQQILEQVRQSLPITEVILIGKAQTGKSSIIQAMTGASAEIIGQGFRPHTAHTQRYAYPTEDLTLLNFIDTVGLGEGLKDPAAAIQELQGILKGGNLPDHSQPAAQVLIATAKISDFAMDAIHRLLQALRQEYPQVPCLLVVTCLHDLYPSAASSATSEHPAYPPNTPEIQRAYAALQAQFSGLYDGAVLIDFTLEEDGYTPILYGLDAFIETLASLLPSAEAKVIHQLLAEAGVGDSFAPRVRISNIYREAGRRYILPFSVMSATLAAVPLPFATMPVLTALQVSMVTLLGRLYGQTITPSQAGGIASAIAGGFAAQLIGRELVKFIPGLGSVIAASWAGAYTWALGESTCVYFGDLMGGKTPDPQKIQKTMKNSFKQAQERFKNSAINDRNRKEK
jgi:uncharacterized protein (DUF697 family)/predicted GTPase